MVIISSFVWGWCCVVWLGGEVDRVLEGREKEADSSLRSFSGKAGGIGVRAGAKWTSHGSLIDKAPNIPPSHLPSPSFASLVYARIF